MSVLEHLPVQPDPVGWPGAGSSSAAGPRRSIGAVVFASAVWMGVVSIAEAARAPATSWHFFDTAAQLVFGPTQSRPGAGLHVYASHPNFQFGPVSIVVAQGIRLVSFGHSELAASVLMGAMAPLILWLVLDTARKVGGGGRSRYWHLQAYVAGVCLPLVWGYLSVYSLHLDDALAITFTAIALWGVAKRSDSAVGLGVGLAMASKPWAAAFVPLVFALPRGRWLRSGGIALACAAVFWLPFILGDSGTVTALGQFRIGNVADSGLRALGVHSRYTPKWDRAAQVAVGTAAGAWCVRTGRWPAVLMAAAAVRLAIDPGDHRYYTAGLVVFVLGWELITGRWPVPVLSLATGLALIEPRYQRWSPAVGGELRLAACVLVLACALAIRGPGVEEPEPSSESSNTTANAPGPLVDR